MINHLVSKAFGAFANTKFAKPIQNLINKSYAKMFKIDFSEFKSPSEYESLTALFTRTLENCRELDDGFISPCDGEVLYCGEGFEGQAFSIKNHTYNPKELLSSACNEGELGGGFDYANLYLSPRDYHNFHAPCDFELLSAVYESGELHSVAPKYLAKISNLYAKNERVILRCKSGQKLFWLVFVGALNVGKIKIFCDERIQTNANLGPSVYEYENKHFSKGEHLGCFELGSSIIIIAQKGFLDFKLSQEQKIKFSQKIADIKI